MTNTTRALSTAALLVASSLAIAGCTSDQPGDTTPSPTASASTSVSPSPSASASPGPSASVPVQESVEVPKSEEEAIAQATKVVEQYNRIDFELQQNPDLGIDYVENFVVPQSDLYKLVQDTIRVNAETGDSVSGEPVGWSTRTDLSYTTKSTDHSTGNEYEFGAVVLKGCADNTKTDFLKDGQINNDVKKRVFPAQVSLFYVAQTGTWLLTDRTVSEDFQC